jgi:hypothetical protein
MGPIVTGMLGSWKDGAARRAVVEFVERTVSDGVPRDERVAVFDNDGTLWCEKPMPIQADFTIRRLADMAQAGPGLRDRQPWKAAYERDYGWFGQVLAEHGFASFIASGGGRDFMCPISQEVYGIPRDRVIGSAIALEYVSDDRGGTIMRKAEGDYVDDGPRSPSGSGAAQAAVLSWRLAIPTVTSPCLSSLSIQTSRPSGCSCCMTTTSASSTTPAVPSRRWRSLARTAGRSSA